jgi:hypothetical protein
MKDDLALKNMADSLALRETLHARNWSHSQFLK